MKSIRYALLFVICLIPMSFLAQTESETTTVDIVTALEVLRAEFGDDED